MFVFKWFGLIFFLNNGLWSGIYKYFLRFEVYRRYSFKRVNIVLLEVLINWILFN